jgi:hypothetical protein
LNKPFLFLWLTLAPWITSISAISKNPWLHAIFSGVNSFGYDSRLMLITSLMRSCLTISTDPTAVASISGDTY